MSLRISAPNMPLTDSISSEILLPNSTGIVIVQHWVQDAIEFALKLKQATDKVKWSLQFLPKPFSQDINALNHWLWQGLLINNPWSSYINWLEALWYLESIIDNIRSENIYVIEVWWCFAYPIQSKKSFRDRIKWVVEVTTFGHNRHLDSGTNTHIPTFSIARSPIKEREARHVGLAIYRSIDKVLHDLDRAITDAKVVMVGYGMIWRNVCRAFSLCEDVSVYDISIEANLRAKNDGYNSFSSTEVFSDADIIVASTGGRSIWPDIISQCKDGVIIASGGSRQNEIDVQFLEQTSTSPAQQIHPFLKKYTINGKSIYLIRDWKNANFSGKSCPAFSMDLIHAETLECLNRIIKGDYKLWSGINETTDKERRMLIEKHNQLWK